MDLNKTLVSTAMLTAIFEKTKKGNIDLMAPFVLFIISKYEAGVTEEIIIQDMETEFSFKLFPHAVLRIIINKLKREDKITKNDRKYILKQTAEQEIKEFKERQKSASEEIKKVIDNLFNYIQETTTIKTSYENVKKIFSEFLDKNGYVIYNNYNRENIRVKHKDTIQFFIAKFIDEEEKKNSEIFKSLISIIEGMLLANVIYLQISPDLKSDLKNLNCYLDAPFLLRILEFKSEEENISANELIELIKQQGAKVKCFRHSFEEVRGILRSYIDTKDITNTTKTLESLNSLELNDTELNSVYMNLEGLFEEKGIIIEDTPPYKKENYKKHIYEDVVIDEKELKTTIIERYKSKGLKSKEIKDKIIDNDIASITSVTRLRKGKKVRKFEECRAIFVTSNHEIRTATNQLLKINEKNEISPIISDVDLTAIMWLRTLNENQDLPKDKLIENARASLKPSIAIIEEYNKCLSKIKKINHARDGKELQSLIYSAHFSSRLMEEIEGNPNNVNHKVITKLYEETFETAEKLRKKSNEEEVVNKKLTKEKEELEEELKKKEKELKQIIDNINEKYDNKITQKTNLIRNIVRIIVDFIMFCILIIGILEILEVIEVDNINKYVASALVILSIYSFIGEFFQIPHIYGLGKYIGKFIYTKSHPKIVGYYRNKQRLELDDLFKRK